MCRFRTGWTAEMAGFRKIFWLTVKDIVLETRQYDAMILMPVFAAMEVLLFVFTLGTQPSIWHREASGILWMGFLFAGILSVTRLYGRESAEEALTGIHMAPGGRTAVFWSKLFVGFAFVFGSELAVWLLTGHLAPAVRDVPALVLVLALGALGIVAVGTLMSAVASGMTGTSPLLAVFVMALEVPLAISASQATTALAHGQRPWLWIHGLIAYDLIFTALPLVLYEFLWEV